MLDYNVRCAWNPQEYPNVWQPGDLHRMFERLVMDQEQQFDPWSVTVLSRPSTIVDSNGNQVHQDRPWVIQLDNLLTEAEAQRMIELGTQIGFAPSVEYFGDTNEFGSTEQRTSLDRRTSETAWCQHNPCLQDATARLLMDRMSYMTGIPYGNAEYLQILKYDTHQYYKVHHDATLDSLHQPAGLRILTFFVYLNDVEEGGGTHFPHLNLTVTPRRGRAVVWPSVLNDDPNALDLRTEHEALPVVRGHKFGINAWFHQREFKQFNLISCT
jgi:prolyl 4-hydroxylase